jgi:hypothetical protein
LRIEGLVFGGTRTYVSFFLINKAWFLNSFPWSVAAGFLSFEHLDRKDQHPAKLNRLTLITIKNCVEPFDLFILSVLGFALFTNESVPQDGHLAQAIG